jgi:hypothetical protein
MSAGQTRIPFRPHPAGVSQGHFTCRRGFPGPLADIAGGAPVQPLRLSRGAVQGFPENGNVTSMENRSLPPGAASLAVASRGLLKTRGMDRERSPTTGEARPGRRGLKNREVNTFRADGNGLPKITLFSPHDPPAVGPGLRNRAMTRSRRAARGCATWCSIRPAVHIPCGQDDGRPFPLRLIAMDSAWSGGTQRGHGKRVEALFDDGGRLLSSDSCCTLRSPWPDGERTVQVHGDHVITPPGVKNSLEANRISWVRSTAKTG